MAWSLAFLLAVIAALPVGAAAAVGAEPFSSGAVAKPASEQEQRTWSEAKELRELILASGVVYEDPALTAYVQGVVDRLYPEFKGTIHVTLLKSPQLNAFAVPDGDIYVNVGLLARFENEAQLATVLAHEGTHFTHRHGYLSAESLKSNAALATFGSLLGVPVLPQLIAVSSMFGYSRELETEADEAGYLRLLQAGYDVREAPKVFEHLMREVKAEDIQEPFFFSTHPKLKDRLDNMTRLSAHAVSGGDGGERDEYSRRMQHARIDTLESMLSMGRAKQALIVLENEANLRELPPHALYWRGEAYRRRGEAGDTQRAEASYRAAIQTAPGYAPSYRALGIILLKDGRKAEAASNFEHYLELAPQAKDRKYVESYLRMANRPEGDKP
jgi:beta-barrel assembly-enhancing protease